MNSPPFDPPKPGHKRPLPLSRRSLFLIGGAAGATGLAALWFGHPTDDPLTETLPGNDRAQDGTSVESLRNQPDRRLFLPREQHLGQYLVTLSALANSVVLRSEAGAAPRGYIAGGWSRKPVEPTNARICEALSVLTWFYSREREWNPYSGHHGLLIRIEAAARHCLTLQHPDGSWPEYQPDEHSVAASAFVLGHMSTWLVHLRESQALPEVRTELIASMHRAARWLLDPSNELVWERSVRNHSNQVFAAVAAIAKVMSVAPDEEVQGLLRNAHRDLLDRCVSPAGFLFESGGMDLGYSIGVSLVHIADLQQKQPDPALDDATRRVAEWLSYCLVPEPDGSGLICFTSASTRTSLRYVASISPDGDTGDPGALLARRHQLLSPLFTSSEQRRRQRNAWAASATEIRARPPSEIEPRIIPNLDLPEALPTHAAVAEAKGQFPMMRPDPWHRTWPTRGETYGFLRTRGFYIQYLAGRRSAAPVRSGIGLLWHPRAGTVVHSGNFDLPVWGATTGDVAEARADLSLTSHVPANGDPAGSEVEKISWATPGDTITVDLSFDQFSLTRSVRTDKAPTRAQETIPLVLGPARDQLTWDDGGVYDTNGLHRRRARSLWIQRNETLIHFDWSAELDVTIAPTEHKYFAGARRTYLLEVAHSGRFDLKVTFSDARNAQRQTSEPTAR